MAKTLISDEHVRKSICGSLRYERQKHGYTQAELATELHRSPSTVNSWEGMDGSVGLDDAWRIAELYGITLDQLAGRAPLSVEQA